MTELDKNDTMAASPERSTAQNARRLFMGNLPKSKTENEIFDEVSRVAAGLVRVITYKNFENSALHRGFCFLDYESPAAAECAKRLLSTRPHTVFGCNTIVDWADPEPEHDDRLMATVRILFVRQYGGTMDEAAVARLFGRYGTVERVKNLKNYAFVHFTRRQDARAAMDALDGTVDADTGVRLDVSWARPPADKHTREQMLRERERRMQQQVANSGKKSLIVPAASTGTDIRDARVNLAAVARYTTYDHYQYEFNRSSFGCAACQHETVAAAAAATATPQRCQLLYCPCVAAVAAEAVAAVRPADDLDESQNNRYHHPNNRVQRQWNRGDQDFTTTVRHDRGDFVATANNTNDVTNVNHINNTNNINSNLDENILKFFLKVINTSNHVSDDSP